MPSPIVFINSNYNWEIPSAAVAQEAPFLRHFPPKRSHLSRNLCQFSQCTLLWRSPLAVYRTHYMKYRAQPISTEHARCVLSVFFCCLIWSSKCDVPFWLKALKMYLKIKSKADRQLRLKLKAFTPSLVDFIFTPESSSLSKALVQFAKQFKCCRLSNLLDCERGVSRSSS